MAEEILTVKEAAAALGDERVAAIAADVAEKRSGALAKLPDEPVSEPEAPAVEAEAEAPPPSGEETTPAVEAEAELPPIDPPASWTKEEKERFASFPRDAQESIAKRESEREREFHQRQRESAERQKALDAEKQQAELIRRQYEQALPNLLAAQQQALAGEFSDIKSMTDVEKMQAEDPFRYQRWQIGREKLAYAQHQQAAAQQRQQQEMAQRWDQFSREEDAKLTVAIPELADPEKAKVVRSKVMSTLKNLGFTDQELEDARDGKIGFVAQDHRFAQMAYKAMQFDEMQAKAKQVRQAPIPPVQKPGTARPPGEVDRATISSLGKQIDNSSGNAAIRAAAKLLSAERKAAAR